MNTAEETRNAPAFQHVRLNDSPLEQVNPMLERQLAWGERTMLARILLRAGCVVPQHSHENEQLSYVLEGALKFEIQGEEVVVRAGEVLVIPSHVPHRVVALEDSVDLDIFCPPRADWIGGTDSYLRK
jgi:quercetin dioxygenase-like cupin family protein